MTRLIDADELKKEFSEGAFTSRGVREIIDNAPTVEIPENSVNCVLTMFGNCSYNETGCSDCEIKNKIRKALKERPKGRWRDYEGVITCEKCGTEAEETTPFCAWCGADMREADNDN